MKYKIVFILFTIILISGCPGDFGGDSTKSMDGGTELLNNRFSIVKKVTITETITSTSGK